MTSFVVHNFLLLIVSAVGPDVDAKQFADLLRGAHSEVRDVEFVFEGDTRVLDGTPSRFDEVFQGTYAYRCRDGAGYIDIYRNANDLRIPFKHSTQAFLDFDLRILDVTPDNRALHTPPLKLPGGASSLNITGSPTMFVRYWCFRLLEDPKSQGYEFQGWEDVDGHLCLRAQFDEAPGAVMPERPVERYWFDMERGGHPLKVELHRGGKVVSRTHTIRLARLPLSSARSVWFPVHGETDTGDSAVDVGVGRVTCDVVAGSLRLNQGLTDARFAVAARSSVPETAALSRLRQAFDRTPSYRAASPPSPSDPIRARQQLEIRLAEADAQAEQLEASSAAREIWGATRYAQVAFATLGAALLLVALARKWRGR